MADSKKVLLVGWDAADWKVIHKLMDEGKMPTVQRLVDNGTMANLATLFPALSPMLWTSIATGKRPYKHGIYGFTEPTPDKMAVQPVTNVSRRSKAVWNILNQNDKKSVVVGWWPSHPAEPVNGAMVSDFFHKAPRKPGDKWELMDKSIYPESLEPVLKQMRIHPSMLQPQHVLPFIPNAAELDQDKDARLSMLMRIICECSSIHRAAEVLLRTQEWDFAAIYYDAIDHFCHGFMKYHPPRQKHIDEDDFEMFHNIVNQGYIYHDQMLAKLLDAAGDDATVILMSDHGFHPDHLRPRVIPNEPAGPAVEHRDLGILVACGEGIKKDHVLNGANLLDIAPTLLSLFGLPYGEDMDGKPLVDMFEDSMQTSTIPSWEDVEGDDGQHPKDMQLDPSQSKETLEQLIALGYIDRPDGDSRVAVAMCQTELDYNLARSFMDGGQFGDAIPLLVSLYNRNPLEFRFGLQLSNCLTAMNRTDELELLVDDLNNRWRIAQEAAKKKIREFAKASKERRLQFRELKKMDEENEQAGKDVPKLAMVDMRGKPILFSPTEYQGIRKIRSVARGNPQILDFLSATIAASKGEFEEAIGFMEKAETSKSKNPMFHFQMGNFYLGLNRLEEAIAAFERALEIDELHSGALMGLCRCYLEKGDAKRATDFGSQAIALKFHFPLGHFYLAEAKFGTGDVDGAIASYNQAVDQNPNFVEVHQRLEKIYTTKSINEQLAKEHNAAANSLQEDQGEYLEEIETIILEPIENLDFDALMPKIDTDNTSQFLRCLGQAKPVLNKLDKEVDISTKPEIVIVSGLPRSGTSMMMQMLVSGGLEAYTDEFRKPDESNPKGYYESEKVKKLAYVNNWVADCEGKVLKVVAPLVTYLPQGFNYRIVLMTRNIKEIVESQEKMLERLNRDGGNVSAEEFENLFQEQLQNFRMLVRFHGIPYCEVGYSQAVRDPVSAAENVSKFLASDLSVERMLTAVDPSLYRQKRSVD